MPIIIICCLLLLAYIFDLTSSRTRIPSVILLLLLGWIARQSSLFFNIQVPDLTEALPILGTIGLILIVLDGSLELELNKSKWPLIGKSVLVSLLPMIALGLLLALAFQHLENLSFKQCLTNVIPLCIISSAIAIPSARNLSVHNKEFVIYESSLSDIFGVLFFNFIVLNDAIDGYSFSNFGLQILIIIVVSFFATVGLAFLLSKIEHHIKFAPIVILVILIYEVSKIYHLPGLIFILFFGLFLGNLDELKKIKWINKVKPDELDKEARRFRELVVEGAFLIRALFFLLFGFLIETAEILNTETVALALGIVAAIFILRWAMLKLTGLPIQPLLFIAPRGLITILLFLAIPVSQKISLVNKSLIIQVIILTSLVMMVGLMSYRRKKEITVDEAPDIKGNPDIAPTQQLE